VYCDNHFPDAAVRLAQFVGQEVLPAHKAELEQGRRVSPDVGKKAASDLWRE
jgi:hypothetical protein